MNLGDALALSSDLAPSGFQNFQRHIDPDWIDEALAATGTATVRKRRLPAEQVVWAIIGMGIFRDRPIASVVASLDLALPAPSGPTAKSAICQARKRIGDEPLAYLFTATADRWARRSAEQHTWRGLQVFAYDGTTVAVPDSPENRAEFGSQWVGSQGGHSGYPAVRVVGLIVVRSHILAALRIGPYTEGEVTLARDLWRELPDHSLTIVDRGLMVASELIQLERSGKNRHWLSRLKRKDTKYRVVASVGPGDEIVELEVSREARRQYPELPRFWRARAITYQREGKSTTLLTSLLDPEQFPAREIVAMYHERWENELAYDEIKTHLLDREETIRSRTPVAVRQELYGIAIAYNLVRLEMEAVADEAKVAPTRISFVMALRTIRDEWFWSSTSTSPGALPKHLAKMRQSLKLWILPERRSDRRYPRAVKVRSTHFPRKKPGPRAK
jgi:hypothetical protein